MAYTREELARILYNQSVDRVIALIAAGTYGDPSEATPEFVLEEAHKWAELTQVELDKIAPTPAAVTPSPQPTPPSGASSQGQPCPDCLAAGRNGVMLAPVHTKSGKTFTPCSLRKRENVNGNYIDTGACQHVVWS